jgi:DNA-binding MarR family transcriptional regulator
MATTSAAIRDTTAETVGLALARSARRLRQQAGSELSPSRAAVLSTIARHGPLTPSALADLERLSRPTITRMISKLEAEGLVDRVQDPADGRSWLISLSSDGSALRALRRARRHAYVARLLASADEAERALIAEASTVLLRLLEGDA